MDAKQSVYLKKKDQHQEIGQLYFRTVSFLVTNIQLVLILY